MRSVRTVHLLIAALTLIAAVAAAPSSASAAGEPPFVTGSILSRDTGERVPNATLSLYSVDQTDPVAVSQSLSNGAFMLRPPAPGRYLLTVQGAGLTPFEKEIVVPPGGMSVDVAMDYELLLQAKVSGSDGRPIEHARVQTWIWVYMGAAGSWVFNDQTSTEAGGFLRVPFPDMLAYSFSALRNMRLEVRVEGAGCWSANFDRWPVDLVPVNLQPGLTVSGSVQNRAGKPAVHAAVSAGRMLRSHWPMIGGPAAAAVTDAQGHYQLTDLFPDTYEFRVALPDGDARCEDRDLTAIRSGLGKAPAAVQVDIGPTSRRWDEQEEMGHVSNLVPAAVMAERVVPALAGTFLSVSGTVVHESAPVEGATIIILDRPAERLSDAARSGPDGSFTLRVPAAGAYTIDVSAPGYQLINATVDVTAPPVPLRFSLDRASMLHARILAPAGGPAKGEAHVEISARRDTALSSASSMEEIPASGVLDLEVPALVVPAAVVPGSKPADVESGTIKIAVRVPGTGVARVEYPSLPRAPFDLQLQPGGGIHGTAVDEAGRPQSGIEITLIAHDQTIVDPRLTAATDAAGTFSFPSLLPGEYKLSAAIPRAGRRCKQVTVGTGEITVRLSPSDRSCPPGEIF